jgi:hypothetical protein
VTTCNRIIWRDISPEVSAHPEAWVNVPRPSFPVCRLQLHVYRVSPTPIFFRERPSRPWPNPRGA